MPAPGGGLVPGVPDLGGVCSLGGAWSGGSGPGGSGSRGVPGLGGAWWRPTRIATAAGGTHPTGMHSCTFKKIYIFLLFKHLFVTLENISHGL